jgi:hypothetical protein
MSTPQNPRIWKKWRFWAGEVARWEDVYDWGDWGKGWDYWDYYDDAPPEHASRLCWEIPYTWGGFYREHRGITTHRGKIMYPHEVDLRHVFYCPYTLPSETPGKERAGVLLYYDDNHRKKLWMFLDPALVDRRWLAKIRAPPPEPTEEERQALARLDEMHRKNLRADGIYVYPPSYELAEADRLQKIVQGYHKARGEFTEGGDESLWRGEWTHHHGKTALTQDDLLHMFRKCFRWGTRGYERTYEEMVEMWSPAPVPSPPLPAPVPVQVSVQVPAQMPAKREVAQAPAEGTTTETRKESYDDAYPPLAKPHPVPGAPHPRRRKF